MTSAFAFQVAPPPSVIVAQPHDSGRRANPLARPSCVISFAADAPGAPWLRARFEELELARGAELVISAVLDGAQQRLDALEFEQWSRTSAYFNGDSLQIEVWAPAGAGPSRVVLAELEAGVAPPQAFTVCGPTDDRVPSSDPRCARAMPSGCSAFLIERCGHGFLSAGHCSNSNNVIEFNVPLSNSSGVWQHPGPEDQYAVDASSKQSHNFGVGDDWAFFGCFPNPVTGLTPFEAQHAAFTLAGSAPAAGGTQQLRVSGFGYDSSPLTRSYTLQTHSGPYVAHSGTSLEYRVDTQPGNSGSVILHEPTQRVIGIHTHGGCDASSVGGNFGTAIENPSLQLALANPLGVCACAPEVSRFCGAQLQSSDCSPSITWSGAPSFAGGAGSFDIGAIQEPNQRSGFLVYGPSMQSLPFHGGTLCVGSLRRTPAQSSGGPGGPGCAGTYHFDMGALIASGLDPALSLGATLHAQYYMRDSSAPSHPVRLTDALQFTIGP